MIIYEDYNPSLKQTENGHPKVLILGSTGSGKSSLCNSLIGDISNQTFKESSKLSSFTLSPYVKQVKWFDSSSEFILIDTPGMNDSEGNDSKYFSVIVDVLKQEVKTLNAFVIVLNSSNPRLDDSLKSMLKMFSSSFGLDFLKQTIIVYTRWSYDERTEKIRNENGENEEEKEREVNEVLSSLLSYSIVDSNINIRCYFIDNSYNKTEIKSISSSEELDRFDMTLTRIKKKILSFPLYFCDKIKKQVSEKDVLKQKLDEQMRINYLHKINRGGCKVCDCLQYHYSTEEFKKKSSYIIAATASSGGILGGIAGLLTGVGVGGVASASLYFHIHICYCGHLKNEHYDEKK